MKKGGGGSGGSKTKTVDLGELAARKNFNHYVDHPFTAEENIPIFDFRSSKGSTEYIVQGDDVSEYVFLNWYDDLANLGDGDDVAVGATGNDTINGDAGNDYLFGDTNRAIGGGRGDDDVLNGGSGDDYLIGDTWRLENDSSGGEDTLAGGEGNDTLWGDGELFADATGGADLFIYDGGHDVIMDFRQEDISLDPSQPNGDKLDVSAKAASFAELSISPNGTDTIISFGPDDTLTLAGFADHTALTAADFIFV